MQRVQEREMKDKEENPYHVEMRAFIFRHFATSCYTIRVACKIPDITGRNNLGDKSNRAIIEEDLEVDGDKLSNEHFHHAIMLKYGACVESLGKKIQSVMGEELLQERDA